MMDELITDLRNKTQMCRFSRGEVGEILAYLKAGGYLVDPTPTVLPAPAHEWQVDSIHD